VAYREVANLTLVDIKLDRTTLIELLMMNLIYRCSTPYSIMHTAATVVVPHTAKGVIHDKDGRWKIPFILRGPVLYGPLGVKRSVTSQAPNGKILLRPGAVNHRT
jgi:hypothetical protein